MSIRDDKDVRTDGPGCTGRLVWLVGFTYVLLLGAYVLLRVGARDSLWWLNLLHNMAPYYFLPVMVFLPLAVLLRLRRLAGFLVLLGALALVWFGPLYLPRSVAEVEGRSFTLLSLNVYPWNEDIDRLAEWVIAQDADIVLLQEMNANTMVRPLTPIIAAYPHSSDLDFFVNSHLILSKYPVIMSEEITVNEKPVLRAIISVDGQPITLYNLRMILPNRQTPRFDAPLIPDLVLRYDESERNGDILDIMAAASDEDQPTIVAGDFNMSEFSFIYETIHADWSDAWRSVRSDFGATWPAGSSEDMPAWAPLLLRLDYVFYSDGLRAVAAELGPEVGSDHLPLKVTFDLLP